LKIVQASEEPTVDILNGAMTIKGMCKEENGNGSDTPSSAMNLMGMMIPFLGSQGGWGRALLMTSFWMTLFSGAFATEHVCTPHLEIEISVPCECPYDNFVDGICMTPTQIADLTVQALFVDFDVPAAASLLAEDYIQHNPTVPSGAAPVLAFIPSLQASGLEIETHRTIAEGNLVAYHSTYTNAELFGSETLIGFDVFRVENGKVQEHWDNLQPKSGPNPSGNSMVDGPTMVKYLSQTEANKEVATSLVNSVLVGGNATAAADYISTETYTQHNPTIADGLEGLGAALEALAEQGLGFVYDSIELVVAQGNFVLTGSPGFFGENRTAYYDLFRVEDGLIVEHWDVIQPIPPASEFAHENGKF
jgi:predicted SnoaL-like aldol condensation-catalyzing enzyme